jgi:putative toxin-antitoxin system antitoxin component (TIGR02293 family)
MKEVIQAQAVRVLGSAEVAEIWMQTPAMALANLKPAQLLDTRAGARQVADHLTRIEYGVYA